MGGGVLAAHAGAVWTPNGHSGGGLLLPGGGGCLTGSPLVPTGNTPYTIVVMLKSETPCLRTCGIVGWGAWGTAGGVTAVRLEGGAVRGWWWGADLIAQNAGLVDGGWHQVAFMYDGALRSLVVDGVVVATDTPTTQHNATAANFGIGVKCVAGGALPAAISTSTTQKCLSRVI